MTNKQSPTNSWASNYPRIIRNCIRFLSQKAYNRLPDYPYLDLNSNPDDYHPTALTLEDYNSDDPKVHKIVGIKRRFWGVWLQHRYQVVDLAKGTITGTMELKDIEHKWVWYYYP